MLRRNHNAGSCRARRLPYGFAVVLLLLPALATCRSGDPLAPAGGSDTPDDLLGSGRVLVGSVGATLATETWVWESHVGGWAPQPLILPAPGIGAGTIARAILRRDRPFSAARPTSIARATTVEGDAAFFAGGVGPGGAPAGAQAYFYDSATDIATPLQLSRPRVDHTVTALYGSRFLVVGGNDATRTPTVTAEVFDAAAMGLQATGSLSEARWGHAASLLLDGRVLVTGGRDATGLPIRQAELWDPATGLFTPAGASTGDRVGHAQVTLGDGRVLVVGGGGSSDAEVWDPEAGDFTATVRMISRHGAGVTTTRLLDGRVLVLGGDGTESRLQATDQSETFDPATNDFTLVGPMNSARMRHFAVVMANGSVLIGGGIDESGSPSASAELYDPVSNRFTTIERVPAAGASAAAVFIAASN